MVQRTPKARFMGGAWVFPGGAVDAHEGEGDAAHRAAAVREVEEEAGLTLPDPAALVPFARWITPPEVSVRFDTYFFLARAPEGAGGRAGRAGDRRRALVRARRGRWRAARRATCCSSSRRSRTSSGSPASTPPTSCSSGRRGTRSSRSSRASSAPARRRGSCSTTTMADGLTVAVTGPTGELGRAFLRALERRRDVARVLGHGPAAVRSRRAGLRKTEYRQGDVLDRAAVDALAAEADVLVHLAFIILGGHDETRAVNLDRLAQRVRRRGRRAAGEAARLHVVGGRLRLPPRQPAAADRGRAGARHRALLLLGPEGGARGGAGRTRPPARGSRSTCCGRASWPGRTR